MESGESRTLTKPKWFFDDKNRELPDEISVKLTRPPVFRDQLSDDDLYELLKLKVREREQTIQAEVKQAGRRFMGVQKLLRRRWDRPPRKPQVRFAQQRRIAGTSRWEILAGLCRDLAWEKDYASCMDEYDAGNDVEFPFGTYLLARRHRVRTAAGPP